MLLKTNAASSDLGHISIKRDPETRKKWIDYFDSGGRACTVSCSDKPVDAFLAERPIEHKGSISFRFHVMHVNEVWSGLGGKLSSIFIKFNGKVYHGRAMDGWSFVAVPDLTVQFSDATPSETAHQIAYDFILKNFD